MSSRVGSKSPPQLENIVTGIEETSSAAHDSPKPIELPAKGKKATSQVNLWVNDTFKALKTVEGEILILSTILKVLLFPS